MDKPTLPNISVNNSIRIPLILCKVILILIMGILLVQKGIDVHQLPVGDDQLFLSFFHRIQSHPFSGLIEVLHERYLAWSGRLSVEAILISTIGYPIFWKTAIPLSLLLIAVSMSRIACGRITVFYSFIALMLLLYLPDYLNFDAAWWIPGFYNYLFPASFIVYTLSVILNHNQSKLEFICCTFSILIFAYMEQTGLCFLLILFFSFLFIPSFRQKRYYFLFTFCLINYIILMIAPGNKVRFFIAAWGWFPEYVHYSTLFKLYYGLEKFHQAMILNWNFPILLFTISLIYLYLKQGIKTFAGYTSLAIITIFTTCLLFKWMGGNPAHLGLGNSFFSEAAMGAYKSDLTSSYTSYFLILMTIFSWVTLIISSFKTYQTQLLTLIILIVGIGNIIAVGLSPTVYISTLRVDYVFELCMIMLCMIGVNESLKPFYQTTIKKSLS